VHDIARLWHTAAEQARRENSARADRVLAHDDLRARLAAPPISLREPDRWTGWIPPKTLPEGMCCDACGRTRSCGYSQNHRALVNDSPRRRALVEIAAEALRREQGQDPLVGDETPEEDPWA
jgi:hypothetical protein